MKHANMKHRDKKQTMKMRTLLAIAIAASTLHTMAAAAQTQPLRPVEAPAGNPANYFADPQLYQILGKATMDAAAKAALATYEDRKGGAFLDLISEVAEDSSASVAARANALNIIAERNAMQYLSVIRTALRASDPRVRAVALNAAVTFHGKSPAATRVVAMALDDAAPEIQGKALQVLGSSDLELLRRFAARPNLAVSVKSVVTGMIQAAEESGAALVPVDSVSGVLERVSATGNSVRYTPTTKWSEWEASVGAVEIRNADGRLFPVRGTIEVVRNVVPVFFSSDGRYAVYEADRHIHVMDMASGAVRDIGPGIAPRVRPITEEFVYVVEDATARADLRDRMKARYEVRSVPFAGTGSKPLGGLGAFLVQGTNGNYSPVRWMRVEEKELVYYLRGAGIETFTLPNPFPGGSGS